MSCQVTCPSFYFESNYSATLSSTLLCFPLRSAQYLASLLVHIIRLPSSVSLHLHPTPRPDPRLEPPFASHLPCHSQAYKLKAPARLFFYPILLALYSILYFHQKNPILSSLVDWTITRNTSHPFHTIRQYSRFRLPPLSCSVLLQLYCARLRQNTLHPLLGVRMHISSARHT